jgi:hypothetical protein
VQGSEAKQEIWMKAERICRLGVPLRLCWPDYTDASLGMSLLANVLRDYINTTIGSAELA